MLDTENLISLGELSSRQSHSCRIRSQIVKTIYKTDYPFTNLRARLLFSGTKQWKRKRYLRDVFKGTLLVSMQNIVLLLQVRLQAAGLTVTYGATQRENYHLRKNKVLELLDAEYLAASLYRGRPFHTDEPYSVVRPHTKTVNQVARYQDAGSAEAYKSNVSCQSPFATPCDCGRTHRLR